MTNPVPGPLPKWGSGTTTPIAPGQASDLPIVGPQIGPHGLPGSDNTPSPGNSAPAPMPNNPVTNPIDATVTAGSQPNNSGPLTGLTMDQVENYWIQAGGNPQAAAMAAAVADASSGLNAAAQRTNPDGTISIGLWLIPQNGTPPGSTDPLANARAAVQLSQNGTDWTQWCVAWSDNNCGQDNGTYLGSGSNALMSLQGDATGASYNVFGSAPAGSGVGASSATSGTGTSTTSSSSKSNLLIFVVIIVIVGVILYFANRKGKTEESEPAPENG